MSELGFHWSQQSSVMPARSEWIAKYKQLLAEEQADAARDAEWREVAALGRITAARFAGEVLLVEDETAAERRHG